MDFNKKPHRLVAYKLAPARRVERREVGMLLGPPGAGESHLAQAHALSAIQKATASATAKPTSPLEKLADATLERSGKEA